MKGKKHPALAKLTLGTEIYERDMVLTEHGTRSRWYNLKTKKFSDRMNVRPDAKQIFKTRDGSRFCILQSDGIQLITDTGELTRVPKIDSLDPLVGSNKILAAARLHGSESIQLVTASGALAHLDISSGNLTLKSKGWAGTSGVSALYDWNGRTYFLGFSYGCIDSNTKELEWVFPLRGQGLAIGTRVFVFATGQIYEPPNPKPLWRLDRRGSGGSVAADPRGEMMIVSKGEEIFLHRMSDGEVIWKRKLRKQIFDIEYSADGSRFVVVHRGSFSIRDTKTGESIREVEAKPDPGRRWTFNADASRGWSVPDLRQGRTSIPLREWSLENGEVMFTFDARSCSNLQLHPEGRYLIFSGKVKDRRGLFILDTVTHKVVWKLDDWSGLLVTWSKDGKRLRLIGDTLYEREWSPPDAG